MNITVIGTGYVGLTVGACLADTGIYVTCVDVDKQKITNLKKGVLPIYEPGLEEIVTRTAKAKRLSFSTEIQAAIESAEIVFSAVGTPPDQNHRADLTAVKQVAEYFGDYAQNYKLFVNKSTVPVGTGKLCAEIIAQKFAKRGVNFGFDVVSNPEFLREGVAVLDCIKPDRIVVGTRSQKAIDLMRKLYTPTIEKGSVFFTCSIESAEIIKYAANSFLATKISFINEVARLSDLAGADITDIERGVGLDDRIGRRFLHAGIGFGGSCFPKDVDALIETGKDLGYEFKIINAVRTVNAEQKNILINKLEHFIDNFVNTHITIWGLAFKPKTDDVRESPAIDIIKKLQNRGAVVHVYDPVAMASMKKISFKDITYHKNAFDAAKGADALLLITEWDEFRSIDFAELKKVMRGNIIGDGRNIWHPDEARKHGFEYFSIGRP